MSNKNNKNNEKAPLTRIPTKDHGIASDHAIIERSQRIIGDSNYVAPVQKLPDAPPPPPRKK